MFSVNRLVLTVDASAAFFVFVRRRMAWTRPNWAKSNASCASTGPNRTLGMSLPFGAEWNGTAVLMERLECRVRLSPCWLALNWAGWERIGSHRHESERIGTNRNEPDRIGSNWTASGLIGTNWTALTHIGSNWTALDGIGPH